MRALHRICPTTGLKIDRQAELLMRANAVAATVALVIGGIAAILILLTRWQAVHLLDVVWFYRILTVHGMSMLIFFILFFEMAILYFTSGPVLNSRIAAPKLGWLAFGLMVAGAVLTEWMMWTGKADVLYTSYVPLKAHPLYYLGVILFAVGALIVTGLFFATLVVAKREKTYEGSMPLITFGAMTAAIIAVITLLHGAAIYVPTFLWSLGLMEVDPQIYRLVWWALGHSSQQINVAAMVSVWYLLGALTVGSVVLNEKLSRTAFVLYILFISMASAHHLLVDPGMSSAWKVVNTSYFMYMAVLASMLHGFTVPAGVELGQRLRGVTKGLFGWIRKAPWGDPGFSSLVFSVVVFGFAGGMLVFSVFMSFAGGFGVPRRHWDITFSNAPFDLQFNPAVDLVMGIMALGGLVAAVGGGIYILVTVWSVFFGEPIKEGELPHAHVRTTSGPTESTAAAV